MLEKDEGVVLKSARSGETSKVVTFLGRRAGKIKLLGKGAMGPRSTLAAVLEPGNLIEVVYYHKEGWNLYFIKEAHTALATEPERALAQSAALLALLELVDQVSYWGDPDERVIDLFIEYHRCDQRDPLFLFVVFELKLLEILGAAPDFGACATCGARPDNGFFHPAEGTAACAAHTRPEPHRVPLTGPMTRLLDTLSTQTLATLAQQEVDAKVRKNLGKILHWTYTFHIQGYSLPKALKLIPKG